MDVVLKGFPDLEDKLKINFVTPVDKNLLCRLCLCLTPQLKRDNSLHGFCGSCFEMLLDEEGLLVCDIEKKKYAQDTIFVDEIEQYLNGLRVRCPNNCGEQVMTFPRFKEHYRNCGSGVHPLAIPAPSKQSQTVPPHTIPRPIPPTSVNCPLCGAQFPSAALVQHCKEQCPERILNCNDCKTDYKGKRLQEHLAECEMRPQPCPTCGQNVPFMLLQEHHLKECPGRSQFCCNCQENIPFAQFSNHVRTCINDQKRQCSPKEVSNREEPRSFSADGRRQTPAGILQMCSQCDKRFPAGVLMTHISTTCPKRVVHCSLCNEEIFADLLEDHMIECETNLAAAKGDSSQDESKETVSAEVIDSLKEEIEKLKDQLKTTDVLKQEVENLMADLELQGDLKTELKLQVKGNQQLKQKVLGLEEEILALKHSLKELQESKENEKQNFNRTIDSELVKSEDIRGIHIKIKELQTRCDNQELLKEQLDSVQNTLRQFQQTKRDVETLKIQYQSALKEEGTSKKAQVDVLEEEKRRTGSDSSGRKTERNQDDVPNGNEIAQQDRKVPYPMARKVLPEMSQEEKVNRRRRLLKDLITRETEEEGESPRSQLLLKERRSESSIKFTVQNFKSLQKEKRSVTKTAYFAEGYFFIIEVLLGVENQELMVTCELNHGELDQYLSFPFRKKIRLYAFGHGERIEGSTNGKDCVVLNKNESTVLLALSNQVVGNPDLGIIKNDTFSFMIFMTD